MIKIITVHQMDEWNWYVKRSKNYDFYHTGLYHSLESNGEPFLFVFHEADDFVAFPLVRRRIEGTAWYDLTSVYGYTGPISNKEIDHLNDDFLDNFKLEFLNFLKKERIVSVFSRLHPLMKQDKLMVKFDGLTPNGTTVAIDLRLSREAQHANYRRSFRSDIRKIKERGYVVKEGTDPADVCLFSRIYTENMLRIKASEHYMFSLEYFESLLESSTFKTHLFFVYAGDEAICGTLVTCTNNILEVHLVATRTDYLCESPAKFLIDEVSVWARAHAIDFLHFGGGFGFKEDSLYEWKRGFSDLCLDYFSWRFIVNPDVYYSILNDRGIAFDKGVDFFPLYRCESLALKRA